MTRLREMKCNCGFPNCFGETSKNLFIAEMAGFDRLPPAIRAFIREYPNYICCWPNVYDVISGKSLQILLEENGLCPESTERPIGGASPTRSGGARDS